MNDETKKSLVLVDYENIYLSLALEGKIVDLNKLVELIIDLKVIIKGAFVFVPNSFLTDSFIEEFYESGFYTIACPSYDNQKAKEKNRVDSLMVEFAKLFYESAYIDTVIIVSNDADFTRIINYFKLRNKEVIVIGTRDISQALVRVADINLTLK